MDIALWVLAWTLAAAFLAAGMVKLVTPRERLVRGASGAWAADFTPAQVKLIGLVEVLGAAGLVLPPLVGVAEFLVPLAAAGLALDMFGAASTHVRRRDPKAVLMPSLVLGTLAVLLAIGRYWVEPFGG